MKKYFIIAAAAVVAMAACSKDQIVDDGPGAKVTFQAANYLRATKSGEVSVFNDFKTFKCRAFMHAEGVDLNADYSVKTDSYQEFFGSTGETISPYDAENHVIAAPTVSTTTVNYWAPSHDYYWPKSEHSFVNFVGWYGTNGSSAVDPPVA